MGRRPNWGRGIGMGMQSLGQAMMRQYEIDQRQAMIADERRLREEWDMKMEGVRQANRMAVKDATYKLNNPIVTQAGAPESLSMPGAPQQFMEGLAGGASPGGSLQNMMMGASYAPAVPEVRTNQAALNANEGLALRQRAEDRAIASGEATAARQVVQDERAITKDEAAQEKRDFDMELAREREDRLTESAKKPYFKGPYIDYTEDEVEALGGHEVLIERLQEKSGLEYKGQGKWDRPRVRTDEDRTEEWFDPQTGFTSLVSPNSVQRLRKELIEAGYVDLDPTQAYDWLYTGEGSEYSNINAGVGANLNETLDFNKKTGVYRYDAHENWGLGIGSGEYSQTEFFDNGKPGYRAFKEFVAPHMDKDVGATDSAGENVAGWDGVSVKALSTYAKKHEIDVTTLVNEMNDLDVYQKQVALIELRDGVDITSYKELEGGKILAYTADGEPYTAESK